MHLKPIKDVIHIEDYHAYASWLDMLYPFSAGDLIVSLRDLSVFSGELRTWKTKSTRVVNASTYFIYLYSTRYDNNPIYVATEYTVLMGSKIVKFTESLRHCFKIVGRLNDERR